MQALGYSTKQVFREGFFGCIKINTTLKDQDFIGKKWGNTCFDCITLSWIAAVQVFHISLKFNVANFLS